MPELVETLYRAAALMRERAEAATPGRWVPFGTSIGSEVDGCTCHGGIEPYGHEQFCGIEGPVAQASEPDITHIASWDPAVALAVANWLDLVAETPAFEVFAEGRSGSHVGKNIRTALAAARAYLEEDR